MIFDDFLTWKYLKNGDFFYLIWQTKFSLILLEVQILKFKHFAITFVKFQGSIN